MFDLGTDQLPSVPETTFAFLSLVGCSESPCFAGAFVFASLHSSFILARIAVIRRAINRVMHRSWSLAADVFCDPK